MKPAKGWRHRAAAYCALLGMFFQALSGNVHAGYLDIATANSRPGVGTIVICTGNGLKTITLDKNGEPVDGKIPPLAPGSKCLICLTQGFDDLTPIPENASYCGTWRPEKTIIRGATKTFGKSRNPLLPQSRAPPVLT